MKHKWTLRAGSSESVSHRRRPANTSLPHGHTHAPSSRRVGRRAGPAVRPDAAASLAARGGRAGPDPLRSDAPTVEDIMHILYRICNTTRLDTAATRHHALIFITHKVSILYYIKYITSHMQHDATRHGCGKASRLSYIARDKMRHDATRPLCSIRRGPHTEELTAGAVAMRRAAVRICAPHPLPAPVRVGLRAQTPTRRARRRDPAMGRLRGRVATVCKAAVVSSDTHTHTHTHTHTQTQEMAVIYVISKGN